MRKKVLVIAYYFPPTGGGGVQRAAKFVKYLPSFNWKPVVLTVKNPDVDIFDESLLNDIPEDVKVYKTYSLDPVRWDRTRRYGSKSRLEVEGVKLSLGDVNPIIDERPYLTKILIKALKYIPNNLVLVPDDYVGWIPFAVLKGLRVIKKEKIDAIYATGKPWSSFIIAFFLSLLTARPYVLDLRDPWVLTPYRDPARSGLRQRIEALWEKLCFSYAKKIININEQINTSYTKHYPLMPSGRFTFITHGFDPDDFLSTRKIKKDKKFTISFIGALYKNTSPDNLLKAASSIISKNPTLRNMISLKFVGFVPSNVLRMIKDLDLQRVVETVGYLPHRESIQHMVSSDMLLLLLDKVKSNTNAQVSTGKLFEYLASRRPILALIPVDTDAAKIINELGAGKVVDPNDTTEIENIICEMYAEYQSGRLNPHTANLEQFDRRKLTGQLANILNEIQQKSSCNQNLDDDSK